MSKSDENVRTNDIFKPNLNQHLHSWTQNKSQTSHSKDQRAVFVLSVFFSEGTLTLYSPCQSQTMNELFRLNQQIISQLQLQFTHSPLLLNFEEENYHIF